MRRPLTVSDSTLVSATPDVIYAQVADPSQMPRWSPENVAGDVPAPGSPLSVGDTFVGTNERGPARWSTRCVVTTADPGREFAFEVRQIGLRNPRVRSRIATWSYTFEPEDRRHPGHRDLDGRPPVARRPLRPSSTRSPPAVTTSTSSSGATSPPRSSGSRPTSRPEPGNASSVDRELAQLRPVGLVDRLADDPRGGSEVGRQLLRRPPEVLGAHVRRARVVVAERLDQDVLVRRRRGCATSRTTGSPPRRGWPR